MTYTKEDISLFFEGNSRNNNDKTNKIRECIIIDIINGVINEEYYSDERWINIKNNLLKVLYSHFIINENSKVQARQMAGRNNLYDILLTIDGNEKKLEFKNNINEIKQAPQFVSPMKPSQYMSNDYEDFFYTYYLEDICQYGGLILPDKNDYLKQIHGNRPECMIDFQDKYYKGIKRSSQYSGNKNDIDFAEYCKKISKKSIEDFIDNTELDINSLSDYLFKNQKGKNYLMNKNGEFYISLIEEDDFKLIEYKKDSSKSCFYVKTKSGRVLKILLRWKNGNGIAFPAFQISLHSGNIKNKKIFE